MLNHEAAVRNGSDVAVLSVMFDFGSACIYMLLLA